MVHGSGHLLFDDLLSLILQGLVMRIPTFQHSEGVAGWIMTVGLMCLHGIYCLFEVLLFPLGEMAQFHSILNFIKIYSATFIFYIDHQVVTLPLVLMIVLVRNNIGR